MTRFTDHAANERTYLAWVRTAIALMGFGFLLERFDIFIAHTGSRPAPRLHVSMSEWVGLALLVFGAVLILLATLRYQHHRKAIDDDAPTPYGDSPIEKFLAGTLILMGIFLVCYVAQQVLVLAQ